MAIRSTTVDDLYFYAGSLATINNNLIVSVFSGPSEADLEADDIDNDRLWEPGSGETATLNGQPILSAASGTSTVGISIGPVTINLSSSVDVNVYETAAGVFVEYPDGDRAALLDALVSDVLAVPGIGLIAAGLGISNLAAYVEQNAVLTFDLSGPVAIPVCFAAGTLIATREGERPVETIEVGTSVFTRDHGFQTVRWAGQQTVRAVGRFAPVRFDTGVMGNLRPLTVSPEHRMFVQGWPVEMACGVQEAFVAAKHFVDGDKVTRIEGGEITYVHLLFDDHEILLADGAYCESFHPGYVGLSALDVMMRAELLAIFPELRQLKGSRGKFLARPSLRAYEALTVINTFAEAQRRGVSTHVASSAKYTVFDPEQDRMVGKVPHETEV